MAFNWLDTIQGALGGAGTGAGIGSYTGNPAGAALGAAGGGILGALMSLLSGGGQQGGLQQAQNVSSEVQSILQFLLQQGQQGLQNPYEGFDDIAKQATNQFNQQTVPSLAERFTSLGNASLSSPDFAANVGQAGAGLQQNLASMKQQYGQQNKQNALQQLQLGMQPSFQNYYQQRQPGFGENLFAGVSQAAPALYQSKQITNALKDLKGLKG